MSGVVVLVCDKKKAKLNEKGISAKSHQCRWILFFDLELEQTLFILKICLLEIQQISIFL